MDKSPKSTNTQPRIRTQVVLAQNLTRMAGPQGARRPGMSGLMMYSSPIAIVTILTYMYTSSPP
jgi:hypothetical protein